MRRAHPGLGWTRAIIGVSVVLAGVTTWEVVSDVHYGTWGAIPGLVTCLVTPCLLAAPLLRSSYRARTALLVAFPLNILALFVIGLLINGVLPLFGDQHPLAPIPLVLSVDAYLLILLAGGLFVSQRQQAPYRIVGVPFRWALPRSTSVVPVVVAGAGALMAVAGAVRLNNGAGDQVGLLALAVLAASVVLLLCFGNRMSPNAIALTVFAIAAGLLLRTSMRGWYITGTDDQTEYLRYLHVAFLQSWHAGSEAYNSCLSITILPQILSSVSGMSGLFFWKAIIPLAFATTPVFVLVTSLRLLSRRRSLLAALAYMAFPTFIYSSVFLARQEVALIFGALVVFCMFGRLTKMRLVVLYLGVVGVVLSHYSSTYYLLATLAGAKGLSLVLSRPTARVLSRVSSRFGTWLDGIIQTDPATPAPVASTGAEPAGATGGLRRTWRTSTPLALAGPFSLAFLIFCFAVAGVWDAGINHVTSSAVSVAHNQVPKDTSPLVISGTRQGQPYPVTASPSLEQYSAAEARSPLAAASPLVPNQPGYALRSAQIADEPLTSVGRWLDSAGVNPGSLNGVIRSIIGYGYQVLALIGVVVFALRRRPSEWRFFLLAAANGLLTVVIFISPVLTASYGAERAFQQGLQVLAPVVAVGLVWSISKCRLPRPNLWIGATVMGSFCSLCGLLPQLTGGYAAQIDFNDLGYFAQSYYTSRQEVASVLWANDNLNTAQPLQLNSLMSLRLRFVTENPIVNDDFPGVLLPNSLLMLGTETIRTGDDATPGGGLAFIYPNRLLYMTKSRIYANSGAALYG